MKKLCLADRWHNVNFRIDVFWKEGCLRNGAVFFMYIYRLITTIFNL